MDAYSSITTSQKLSLPLNGTIYTTRRTVAAEKTLPAIGGNMALELGSTWSDSLIIDAYETPQDNKKVQTLIHARIPSEEVQLLSNWEWSKCSIGGQNFDSISRTVIYPASSFSKSSPAPASAMPIGSDNLFSGDGFILIARSAGRAGMQLEPTFKVENRQYVKRVPLVSVGIDPLNGKPLFDTTTLYHGSETVPGTSPSATAAQLVTQPTNTFWGVQATGFENTGGMLTAEWYQFRSTQVVAGTITGGVVAVVADVPSNDRYTWPAVLQYVDILDWTKRQGGADTFNLLVFKHERYDGPCKTETTRTWSKSQFVIPVVEQLLENNVNYASPFFTYNIPPCLHGRVVCQCDIGSDDPTYTQNTGSLRVFEATNFTDWPASIIAHDDQEQYRGGFLRTTVKVYSPEGTGGGAAVVLVDPPTDLDPPATGTDYFDLDWTAAAGATDHLVEVALDEDFLNLVAYQRAANLESDTVTGLQPSTTYYARVSTLKGIHLSAPCAAITNTTAAP
jgi:hypothetical protein